MGEKNDDGDGCLNQCEKEDEESREAVRTFCFQITSNFLSRFTS